MPRCSQPRRCGLACSTSAPSDSCAPLTTSPTEEAEEWWGCRWCVIPVSLTYGTVGYEPVSFRNRGPNTRGEVTCPGGQDAVGLPYAVAAGPGLQGLYLLAPPQPPPEALPRHVGVMLDGNRRWARQRGAESAEGHRAGAENIAPFLGWCEESGIEVVTLWLLSTDNLNRPTAELEPLLRIIEQVVTDLAAARRWQVRVVGALDLLPEVTAQCLSDAAATTDGVDGLVVNVAIGYGGRREIADAVRSLLRSARERGQTLEELAATVTVEDIADHLYTRGQPDPDLVIRTSGEQRLGGFLLWQSAHSEFYFCEAYWPDFRQVDFLRALRAYAERERRFGT
ncbi:isoprenyl transferase [Ornithinimicrobium pratense]|uniref:Isoprenyl transferase n=1 Tax=Ornithinimicrobium pratense TaxID=2593973 RepID=A0A5J6VAG3_9MICO|nr:isoprenyl transferase [Ornithinimicrobium pratense]